MAGPSVMARTRRAATAGARLARPGTLGLALALASATAGAYPASGFAGARAEHTDAGTQQLTIVTWGGSYGRASAKAWFEPFTAETGIEINVEDYSGGLAQIRAQADIGNVYWDVVDIDLADAVRGCDDGLLELVDVAGLAPAEDGTPAEEDFVPETLTECGVGTNFYSTIYAYDSTRFAGERPSTMADFFDLEKFPGRRGMKRWPKDNLERALVADGVPLDQVYATLSTREGVRRAFRKLDTIKEHIVWWETSAQAPQLLADGEAVMTSAYNGRIFNAQVLEDQPFRIVWDGQILDVGQFVVVAGTPNLEAAQRFVAFASSPVHMVGIAKYISYGPTRASAMPLVDTHLETGIDMRPHMPTNPDNLVRGLKSDWLWWSDNGDEMNEIFAAWLAR